MSKTKNTFLKKLHATPDGKYQWTKTQLKKLAEFEEANPTNKQYDWSGSYGEPDSWRIDKFTAEENAIVTFAQDMIAHNNFDNAQWTQLVQDLYQTMEGSFSFQKAFYDIEQALINRVNIHIINVLHMFYINEREARKLKKDQGWITASVMYRFINRRIGDDKTTILAEAQRLIERDGSTEIVEYFTCLFPHDFDITAELIKKYDVGSAYGIEMPNFLDDIGVYAEIYAQYFWNISEPHVLLAIKKHHEQIIKLMDRVFRKTYVHNYGDNAKKASRHLRILDRLYHVDVLQFLLDTAEKLDMHKSLDGWLKRFPIYTLNHIFEQNLTANYFEKDKYADLTKQMQNFFRNNPAIIKAYQDTLNGKSTEQTNTHLTDDKKNAYLKTLDRLTTNIDEEAINVAYAEATASASKSPNKTKTQAKNNNDIKKLKFPNVAINRIKTQSHVVKKHFQPKHFGKWEWDKFDEFMTQHKNYVFRIHLEKKLDDELAILEKEYDNFSEEQKLLLLLSVRPSWLTSEQYQLAKDDNYVFTKADFSQFSLKYNYKLTNHSHIYRETIVAGTLQKIDDNFKKAIFRGETPFEQYRMRGSESAVNDLGGVLSVYAYDCGNEVLDEIFATYYPLFYQYKVWIFTFSIGLDSYHVVPYYLNVFNTKTKQDYLWDYFKKYPETVVYETIYLLFTKQTEPLLKKAKTNAKLFWDWLLENDKDLLKNVLSDYDQQLTTPALTKFLTDYQANQVALTQQAQQLEKQATATVSNDNGIPDALLNDDWQKATRKRNFDIPDYVPQSDTLPQLVVAKTGEPLPKDAFERVLQMLMINVSKPIPNLLNHLNKMTHESQQALAKALWNVFLRNSNSKNKWLIMASGLLYHAQLDDTVWSTIKENESNPWGRGIITYAIEALAEQAISRHQLDDTSSSADRALRMLIKISQKARATIRPTAETQLQRYSEQAGISKDDMADKLIPTLGLDAQGKRVFDFGERQFTLSLDTNLKPKFVDNNGKAFKNMPKAGQKDDAEKAAHAHAELKELKKQLKEFIRDDVPRMENMLITQRRMRFENFNAFYVNNPLMLRYSYQLVWGVFDKDNTDKLIQPFRVVETGEILDINDDDLTLADDAIIGLVHPMQLSNEQKSQLGQSLQDDEIIQPFAQLARPVYFLTDEEKTKQTITRFNDEKFATGSLIGFKNKGWESEQWGGGVCNGYSKTVNGHNLYFTFNDGFGLWEGVPDDDKGQTLEPIGLPKGMSDIDISEFIYVLDNMARLAT